MPTVRECVQDAYAALKNFVVRGFDEEFDVIPGIKAKFKVAGHIAGSAIAEIFAEEDGKKTKIIFTGDVGQPGAPILEDPEQLQGADFIIKFTIKLLNWPRLLTIQQSAAAISLFRRLPLGVRRCFCTISKSWRTKEKFPVIYLFT